jgi:hypothetical protein
MAWASRLTMSKTKRLSQLAIAKKHLVVKSAATAKKFQITIAGPEEGSVATPRNPQPVIAIQSRSV